MFPTGDLTGMLRDYSRAGDDASDSLRPHVVKRKQVTAARIHAQRRCLEGASACRNLASFNCHHFDKSMMREGDEPQEQRRACLRGEADADRFMITGAETQAELLFLLNALVKRKQLGLQESHAYVIDYRAGGGEVAPALLALERFVKARLLPSCMWASFAIAFPVDVQILERVLRILRANRPPTVFAKLEPADAEAIPKLQRDITDVMRRQRYSLSKEEAASYDAGDAEADEHPALKLTFRSIK